MCQRRCNEFRCATTGCTAPPRLVDIPARKCNYRLGKDRNTTVLMSARAIGRAEAQCRQSLNRSPVILKKPVLCKFCTRYAELRSQIGNDDKNLSAESFLSKYSFPKEPNPRDYNPWVLEQVLSECVPNVLPWSMRIEGSRTPLKYGHVAVRVNTEVVSTWWSGAVMDYLLKAYGLRLVMW